MNVLRERPVMYTEEGGVDECNEQYSYSADQAKHLQWTHARDTSR